jgi:glyoxylase-like metal-dependent hydrolase (beta-lactamase superfamily II)
MATAIPYVRDIEFEYGRIEQVTPLVRRIVCNNPGAFTYKGTGTYVVGKGNVAVIDPGPLDDLHIAALLAALDGETITHQVITHTHRDHSPAAAPVKHATAAPTYGYGPHHGNKAQPKVEEGGDWDFRPDVVVQDGDVIEGHGWTLEAVHTPGHTSNHLCYALKEEKILFSGDHVMGWSTSVISPPDGDMAHYLHSLHKLLLRDDDLTYWPTHGPAITAPKPHVQAFLAHRHERETAIRQCIADGHRTIGEMVPIIYKGVDERLYRAAGRSVLAHLIQMQDEERVRCEGEASADSVYELVGGV